MLSKVRLGLGLLSILVGTSDAFAIEGVACVRQQSGTVQAVQNSCEIFRKNCESVLGGDPYLTRYIRDCGQNTSAVGVEQHLLTCVSLVPKPLMDSVEKLVVSLAQRAKKNLKLTRDFVDQCGADENLREYMISKVPILKTFSGKPPSAAVCSTIVVEFQNWSMQFKDQSLLANVTDFSLRKRMEEALQSKGSAESQDIFKRIWEQQKEKFSCLNNQGKTYLSCYYLFSVVDPLMMAGLAIKAPRLIKAFNLTLPNVSRLKGIEQFHETLDDGISLAGKTPFSARAQIDKEIVTPHSATQGPAVDRGPPGVNPTIDSKASASHPSPTSDRGPPQLVGLSKVEKLSQKKAVAEVLGDDKLKVVKIYQDTQNGKATMGTMDFTYSQDTGVIHKGYMSTSPEYRNLGVGEALMEQAIKASSGVRKIETCCLIETNRQAVTAAINRGMTKVDAIKQTPAFKIRARFGFTEIDPDSIDSYYGFTARRPLEASP